MASGLWVSMIGISCIMLTVKWSEAISTAPLNMSLKQHHKSVKVLAKT